MGKRYPALDISFAPGPGAGSLRDILYAELDSFEPSAIQEHEGEDGWRVFFSSPDQRADARHALQAMLGGHVVEITPVDVEDEDWARRSQANLTAVRVGRIIVAPPWDLPSAESRVPSAEPRVPSAEPRVPSAEVVIIIDPSMGFGTGHHATTRLCLELMQQLDLTGARVVDVGTGSGVLAIAARKLGAASVVAVDHDPDALQNARDNIAANAVDRIDVIEADLDDWEGVGPADLVVANLTGAVLRCYARLLRRLVAQAGTMIVSGFSPLEATDIVEALGGDGEVVTQGDWAALRVEPNAS